MIVRMLRYSVEVKLLQMRKRFWQLGIF